jgi:hypothetical protein
MTAPTRLLRLCLAALLALSLALALPLQAIAAAPKYTKETKQGFEAQLKHHEIASAKFNNRIRSLRITTKSGQLFTFAYPKKGSRAVEAQLRAHHVSFTKLSATEAKNDEKRPVKHKIRYIVAAVVLVLILIGALVLVLRRRRSE